MRLYLVSVGTVRLLVAGKTPAFYPTARPAQMLRCTKPRSAICAAEKTRPRSPAAWPCHPGGAAAGAGHQTFMALATSAA